MTLVILAAGLGSRYGGLKQLDPMTENGEFIIDFSVYDAVLAGFDKVVFIIKKENLEDFEETIGSRVRKHIKVEYAFQDINDIPEGYAVPEGREKPWGTTHALLSTRNVVTDNFAVINADDFYGRDMFMKIANHLKTAKTENGVCHSCMVGYVLQKTLTENGTVSRGVCVADENDMLTDIVERTKIKMDGDMAAYLDGEEWVRIPYDSLVSMNCWGFTPEIFDGLEVSLKKFFANGGANELKSECFLPNTVREMIGEGTCDVKVYSSTATWYGVTYKEDKEYVKSSINKLIEDGTYPAKLWN